MTGYIRTFSIGRILLFVLSASGQSKFRPKSAKAARSALAGSSRNPHAVDPDTLAARRALAEKLKNEVISHTDK